MFATFINCLAVLAGSCAGVIFNKRIKQDFQSILFTAVGVFTLVIGFQMAFQFTRAVYGIFSLILGGWLGHRWDLEERLLSLGDVLRRRFFKSSAHETQKEGSFSQGFLTASLLFCVGAMTIVGSLKAGIEKDYTLIFTKSLMDGFSAIALASALGIGVIFSVFTILLVQGGLTLLAMLLGNFIPPLVLSELSSVGGMIIIMIGLNLLEVKKIKTANFVPALVLVSLFCVMEEPVRRLLGF